MTKIYYLLGCLLLLNSCYKDQGNYDYTDVNEFSIAIKTELQGTDSYLVNQPAMDTASYIFTAEAHQSMHETDANLDYVWYSSFQMDGVNKMDTLSGKTVELIFPPRKKSQYTLTCKATDKNTKIEYFKYFTVKTKIPFVNSWILLHGEEGKRSIGALEFNEGGATSWTADMYKTLLGTTRFGSFSSLMYSPINTDWRKNERLFVGSKDSCVSLFAFDLSLLTPYSSMMPAGMGNPRVAFMVSNDVQFYSSFVDVHGKYFNGKQGGLFYRTDVSSDIGNYQVDRVYISKEGYTVLWDKNAKRLMYYAAGMNDYGWSGTRNDAGVTEKMKFIPEEVLAKKEFDDKTVLWLGRGARSTDENEDALVIAKDKAGVCYSYAITFGEMDDEVGTFIQVEKHNLGQAGFDEQSRFATSQAFNNQFFYSKGGNIYQYNLNSKADNLLYETSGIITQLKFRISNYDFFAKDNTRKMGMVVRKDAKTVEFHEISLTNGGDLEESQVHAHGFSDIADFIFTNVQRVVN